MEHQLQSYSDADHGGDEMTGCSTSGIVCIFAGSAVSWLSHRQTSVAISSTEVGIGDANETTREIVLLTRLSEEILVPMKPCLYVDINEAAIR